MAADETSAGAPAHKTVKAVMFHVQPVLVYDDGHPWNTALQVDPFQIQAADWETYAATLWPAALAALEERLNSEGTPPAVGPLG